MSRSPVRGDGHEAGPAARRSAYCRAALATSALKATDVPQMSSPPGCELHDVERVAVGRAPAFSNSFVATCALAVDLAMLIEHVVKPAARATWAAMS